MHSPVGGAYVTHRCRHMIILHAARLAYQPDARSNPIAIAFTSFRLNDNPVIVIRGGIIKHRGRLADGRNQHVDLAIVIQVAKGRTTVRARYPHGRTSLAGHAGESASQIAEHAISLPV